MTQVWTIAEARTAGAALLAADAELHPRSQQDAALLLQHALGCTRAELLAHPQRPLTLHQQERYHALLAQRLRGTPMQYILGEQEFFGMPFFVTPAVLIPRPETEHLVEAALARLRALSAPRIVDVGTGSGAIAIALAHALPQAQVTAIDISPAALAIAQRNAERNAVAARIRWMEGDLLTSILHERLDAVISNPPYIAQAERKALPREVREHEPAQALFAGPTGLEVYERLLPQARAVLAEEGWLLAEIGAGQRDSIAALLSGWRAVEFLPDLQGIPRVVCAQP
jgi:release factor glutamine methyltransferase